MNPALASLFGVLVGLWVAPPSGAAGVAGFGPLLLALGWWVGGLRCFGLVAALCLTWVHTLHYREGAQFAEFAADRLLAGCIVSIPRTDAEGRSFRFRAAGAGLLQLRTYDPQLLLQAGECHALLVRLKPPHGQLNHGQFDRALWLLRERIIATGYVRESPLNRRLADAAGEHRWLRFRAALAAAIAGRLADSPVQGIVQGLVLGARGDISAPQWEVFRQTGTLHLMAISGLHVTLVAGFAWLLLRWLPLPGAVGTPVMRGRAAAVLAAVMYALLAGWTVPASRAALMLSAVACLTAMRRECAALAGIWLALTVALFADPHSVLGSGFWMSYLAVGLLLTAPLVAREAGGLRSRIGHYLRSLLAAQWRLSAGLALPSLLLFGAIAPLAPLVNLLAIPAFTVLLPGLLLATAAALQSTAGDPLLVGAASALELLLRALAWCAQWPPGQLLAPDGPAVALLFGLGCCMQLVRCPSRRLAGLLLLAGAWLLPGYQSAPQLRVDVLDVGQGTAVVVRTGRRTVLLDTGPAWRGGDAAATVILPFLRREGISRIDLIVVSHADKDHSGGLRTLRRAYPGALVVRSRPSRSDELACRRGVVWYFDAVQFRFLHPGDGVAWTANDASCVLAVRVGEQQLLFPGDIESRAEAVLTAREPELGSTLALAPHHGSPTSSSPRLVAAVAPEFVVYTTGYRNRWGFPSPLVVRAWGAYARCQLATAATGALRFEWSQPRGLRLTEVRAVRKVRPWVLRAAPDELCLGA